MRRLAPRIALALLFLGGTRTAAAVSQVRPSRPTMEDIVWESRSSYFRLVIEFSEQLGNPQIPIIHAEHNLLPGRPIIYIDFHGLRPRYSNQQVRIRDGLLDRFEIVNYEDSDVVRLIFVLEDPQAFNQLSVSEEGYHLFVDLTRRSARGDTAQALPPSPAPTSPRAAAPADQRPSQTQARTAPGLFPPSRRHVVIVDPGHGGRDLGAQSEIAINRRRVNEKDVTLEIARRLARRLNATGQFETHLTRTSDRDMSLDERVQFAHEHRGDVFISIHANHAGNRSRFGAARGLELYYISNRGVSRHSQEIAANGGGGRGETELLRLAQSGGARTRLQSIDLCRHIGAAFLRDRYWQPESRGGHFRFIRGENFHVLRNFDMPCVLVETGYVTHPEEVRLLLNEEFQERIAEHIAAGLVAYFEGRDRERTTEVAGG